MTWAVRELLSPIMSSFQVNKVDTSFDCSPMNIRDKLAYSGKVIASDDEECIFEHVSNRLKLVWTQLSAHSFEQLQCCGNVLVAKGSTNSHFRAESNLRFVTGVGWRVPCDMILMECDFLAVQDLPQLCAEFSLPC